MRDDFVVEMQLGLLDVADVDVPPVARAPLLAPRVRADRVGLGASGERAGARDDNLVAHAVWRDPRRILLLARAKGAVDAARVAAGTALVNLVKL